MVWKGVPLRHRRVVSQHMGRSAWDIGGDQSCNDPGWVLWVLLPSWASGLTQSQLLLLLRWKRQRGDWWETALDDACPALGVPHPPSTSDPLPRTSFLAQVAKAILCSSSLGDVASPGRLGQITRGEAKTVSSTFLSGNAKRLLFGRPELATETFSPQPAGISDFASGTLGT